MTVITIRYLQPHSTRLRKKDHANLIASLLAAGADVIDFVEYSQDDKIVKTIGVDAIYGRFFDYLTY